MIKQLLKDIFNNEGKTKIDINEIARKKDGVVEPLGELIDLEFGENENGTYIKSPSGLLICRNRINLVRGSLFELKAEWNFPHPMINTNYSISAMRENKDNNVYRGSAFDYEFKETNSIVIRLSLSNGISTSTNFNSWAEVSITGRWK